MKITAHSITDFDSKRSIPDGWRVDPEQPDQLLPPWSYCQYRRVSYNPQTLVITPICRLISQRITTETCLSCDRQLEEKPLPDTSGLPLLERPFEGWQRLPEGCQGTLASIEEPEELDELNEEFSSRFDLTAIRATPFKKGRDRAVRVESDGTIVYRKGEKDWEPPRDINGYQRDPNDSWRFIPLWFKCMKRQPITKRNKGCGGIQITMKCRHPESELNGESVTYQQCQQCSVRCEQEGD